MTKKQRTSSTSPAAAGAAPPSATGPPLSRRSSGRSGGSCSRSAPRASTPTPWTRSGPARTREGGGRGQGARASRSSGTTRRWTSCRFTVRDGGRRGRGRCFDFPPPVCCGCRSFFFLLTFFVLFPHPVSAFCLQTNSVAGQLETARSRLREKVA